MRKIDRKQLKRDPNKIIKKPVSILKHSGQCTDVNLRYLRYTVHCVHRAELSVKDSCEVSRGSVRYPTAGTCFTGTIALS